MVTATGTSSVDLEGMEKVIGEPFGSRFTIFQEFLSNFDMSIENFTEEQIGEFLEICSSSGDFESASNIEEPLSPLRKALAESPKKITKYVNVTSEFLGSSFCAMKA